MREDYFSREKWPAVFTKDFEIPSIPSISGCLINIIKDIEETFGTALWDGDGLMGRTCFIALSEGALWDGGSLMGRTCFIALFGGAMLIIEVALCQEEREH